MSEATAPAPSAGQRWIQIVKLLLGVGLIVLVVWLVDWRDSVVLADATPQGHKVAGEIVGDVPRHWDADSRVTFRTADGEERTYAAADLHQDKSGAPDVNEGIVRIVRRSDKTLLLVGLVLFGFITHIGVLRWWLLLRAQDIRVPFGLARRLTFLGFFFNNVVPGPTGGDLVKAVYIARQTHNRAQAIVTVAIDRIVGILALALIAAIVLVFHLDNPQFRELAAFIGLFLGGVAVAAMLFFSRRIRRLIGFENETTVDVSRGMSVSAAADATLGAPESELVSVAVQVNVRFNLGSLKARCQRKVAALGTAIRKADEAVFLWRNHKKDVGVALALSFANQLSIQGMMLVFAAGLHVTTSGGEPLPWTSYMVVLPVAFIVSALPVLPGGWGVREAAFAYCFHFVDVERNPAIALSVVNGMTQLAWSLLGGVYFLLDRGAALPVASVATPPGIDEAAR